MKIQFTSLYNGVEHSHVFDTARVELGRPAVAQEGVLDLAPDPAVSRRHAAIEQREDGWWVTDLGSRSGTRLNGLEIRELGACRLWPGDSLVLGDSTLRFQTLASELASPAGEGELPPAPAVVSGSRIEKMVDTSHPPFDDAACCAACCGDAAGQRLALLLELPLQFAAERDPERLFPLLMNRIVQAIPAARRGALLLRDPRHDTLLLKAYVSPDEPAVSETLARRAIKEGLGFIWRQGPEGEASQSVRQLHIFSGMYVPLRWGEQIFGVVCVDSPRAEDQFSEDDLRFLVAAAQYAGMAMANQRLEETLQREARTLERLLAHFSPKIRKVLLEQARQGRLRPGGTKSEVTIVFCDICGFTKRAASMDAEDVLNLLNEYFPALVQAVFRFDGTIDKFVGDAVLAVFGSPEPDAQHALNGVRAALAMQAAVREISERRLAAGELGCEVAIGVHTGEVLHGFVGAAERLEFTVIGDPVNRASRYCDAAGGGQVLISAELYQRVYGAVQAEKATVESQEGALPAYRVKGLRPAA